MMQEHPFFSSPQVFFGKAIEEGDDEDDCVDLWISSLQKGANNLESKTGLFIFWTEVSTDDPLETFSQDLD